MALEVAVVRPIFWRALKILRGLHARNASQSSGDTRRMGEAVECGGFENR